MNFYLDRRQLLALFFLSLSAIFSCSEAPESLNNTTVEIDLSKSSSAKLSDFFERLDYVLLDYSDEKPIVFPYKMAFSQDLFFVESRENASIFIFDWEGKVKKIIQNYGDGLGEFRLIDGLFLQDSILNVYVRHKLAILKFTMDGEFISEEKVSIADDFHFGEEFRISHIQDGDGKDQKTFFRISKNDTIGYVSILPGHEGFYIFASPVGFIKDASTGKIYFKEWYSYAIQEFDSSGFYLNTINFDFGRHNYPEELRLNFIEKPREAQEYLKNNPIIRSINSFFAFDKKFFLTVSHSPKKSYWIFLDKEFIPNAIIDELENDIDGSLIKMRTWTQTPTQIVYQIDSRQFFNDYVETFNDQQVEISEGNIHDFFAKNREKLKEEKYVLVLLKVK